MSTIRIEKVPISVPTLGILGYNHLHLVLEPDVTNSAYPQDEWLVLEGIRDVAIDGFVLGVEGIDGDTTLPEANGGRYREELVEKIGTPDDRGSRAIDVVGGEFIAWQTMAAYGADIQSQGLPYLASALPSLLKPNLNSSSVIATLLYSIGVDISGNLPFGRGKTPGWTTLIGTSGADELAITGSFTTLVAGGGDDRLIGTDDIGTIEKFYGGTGNDIFVWSKGINVFHGGQPELDYETDGTDTVDYFGVGLVRLDINPAAVPHMAARVIATRADGVDYLLSIERIEWNEASDQIVLGDGLGLLDDSMVLELGDQSSSDQGDSLDFSGGSGGLVLTAGEEDLLFVQADGRQETDAGLWLRSVEWVVGSRGDDAIYSGSGMRGVEGAEGADLIDVRLVEAFSGLSPQGYDIEIDGGPGDDIIVSGSGRTLATGGEGADSFVLSATTSTAELVEFVITDAEAADRVYVPYSFFDMSEGPFEGSELMPLLGAFAQYPGENSFADLPQNEGPFLDGPIARDDFFVFEWQLQADEHQDEDQTIGIITFTGMILYNRDGDDLLIHIFLGFPEEVVDFAPDETTYMHILNTFIPGTETIIRVVDFQDGDLGIVFYDLGEPDTIDVSTDHGDYAANDYPGWDAAVHAITNDGIRLEALPERPTAPVYDLDEDQPGSEPNIVLGTDSDDVIAVASGDNVIDAGDGNDTVETAEGDDSIDGGAGDDEMTGGPGDDSYVVDSTGDVVIELAGGGIDRVIASIGFILPENVEYLSLTGTAVEGTGNALANRMIGNDGANTLRGLEGNDLLYGGGGDDLLDGGGGSDGYLYAAGEGYVTIADQGASGDTDTLYLQDIAPGDIAMYRPSAAPGDLVLTFAQGGHVRIAGYFESSHTGVDVVRFQDGTQWTRSEIDARAASAPVLDNEAPTAFDDFDYAIRGPSSLVPAALLLANDQDFDDEVLRIVAISDVTAGASVTIEASGDVRISVADGFDDTVAFTYTISDGRGGTSSAEAEFVILPPVEEPAISGTDGSDTLSGTAGSDRMLGRGGNDVLAGLDGDDILSGGAGADRIDGGAGVDTADYSDASGPVAVRLGAGQRGRGTLGDAAGDRLVSIENIEGSAFDDVLAGNSAANTLSGNGGADRLAGRRGDDRLDGGAGNDWLSGGPGSDVFVFRAGYGSETVADLNLGLTPWQARLGRDTLELDVDGFSSIDDILAHAVQSGADVVIDFGGGDSLTLEGTALASLNADDFRFV